MSILLILLGAFIFILIISEIIMKLMEIPYQGIISEPNKLLVDWEEE
jgi:hypothetical protein